jgi:serine/threonine-protein kinase
VPDAEANPEREVRTGRPDSPVGYELLKKLGGGGMGDVYLARDLTAKRLVAMKFLQAPSNPGAVVRFLGEVRALAKLDHPHIVRVFGHDFYRTVPYFTMEYMECGTLADRVKKNGPLAPVEAAKLLEVVARAMSACHENAVIHRDLKPSNVLLTKDGTPKVSDFGLAKHAEDEEGLTIQSAPIGTANFMSPEQVSRRHGNIDAVSDVYGLGATLYYLLTGCPPFKGEHDEVLAQVVSTPPCRLRALKPEIPQALEAIVHKCLAKNAKDRYQTMTELADDLEKFLAGEEPTAPRLTRMRRLRQWVAWHRVKLVGAGAVVIVAVVLVWMGLLLTAPTPETPTLEEKALAELKRRLADGQPVDLIPDVGKPPWHRWVLGSPELALTPEGICSFEAMGQSMLELCPDTMCNHYLLRAEIQFRITKPLIQNANQNGNDQPVWIPGTTKAGVYCSYGVAPGNGGSVHTALVVLFDDSPPRPGQGIKPPLPHVELRRWGQFLGPDLNPAGGKMGLGHTLFTPPPGNTGLWRVIEIEISPDRILCWWQEPDGTKTLFANKTLKQCNEANATVLEQITARIPNHGVVIQPVSPRMPVGIWNERASIAVRKVSLTPLP